MHQRILAVVVSFNPRIESLAVLLQSLVQQQVATLVVDNASQNQAEVQAACTAAGDSIDFSPQAQNLGLGAAHNIGIRTAQQRGCAQILLLDQDSVPLKDMVANLATALDIKQSNQPPVAAVGATYLNADNGSESFFVRFGWFKFRRQYCGQRDADGCVQADFLISSGSLIDLEAIEAIGLMDEGLFIDHVDTDWFLRAGSKGYSMYGVCDAVMQHGLGENTHQINIGGTRQRNVPQHKPFRYYYIFRNSVLLYRRPYSNRLWRWNDLQRLLLIVLMFAVFKSPRAENARMMWRGLLDGIRGRQGKAF